MTERAVSAVTTLAVVGVVYFLSWGAGRLAGKRGVAGVALGFLCLCGGTNITLWLVRSQHMTAGSLIPISILFVLLLLLLAWCVSLQDRRLVTAHLSDRRHVIAFSLSALVVLVPVIAPLYPYASWNFFDAWTPIWLKESLEAGYFLVPSETSLGQGFLTSADDYEWNALGLISLVATALPVEPIVASVSVQYCAKLLTLALVYSAIAPALETAIFVGAGIALAIFTHSGVYTMIAGRPWDDVFLLASAGVFFASAVRGDIGERLKLVILFSMFLGWGRKYALVYGALFAFCATIMLLRQSFSWKDALRLLVPAGVIGLLSILRPLQLLLQHGDLFYPRVKLLDIYPRDLAKSAVGIMSDVGLLEKLDKLDLYLPSATALWVFLLILFLSRPEVADAEAVDKTSVYFPLLLIAAPIGLELLTGFRKSTELSKLFICSVPFVIGYVWVLQRELTACRPGSAGIWYGRRLLVLVLGCCLLDAAIHVRRVAVWGALNCGLLDVRPSELVMVDSLRRTLQPAEFEQVVRRTTIYLHYEPGIGYRFFAGGNLSRDLDFWSEKVQRKYQLSNSTREYLNGLGRPNVYVSHDPFYQKFTLYDSADRLLADLARLEHVKCVVADDGARFFYFKSEKGF